MQAERGWTGTLDNFVYTLKCAGSKTLTATADQNQVRITKVVVSDSESVDDPVTPPFRRRNLSERVQ